MTLGRRIAVDILACLSIVAVVVAIYAPTLRFGLLNWDDPLHLVANPYLQPDWPDRFGHFWREPYGKLYVPITYNAWAALYALCVDADGRFVTPVPLRVANISLHAVNALLVMALLRALRCGRVGAWVGATLFAAAPLQVESVAWISEFRGLLSAAFALLAMLAHVRSARWTGAALLAAAILCKPSAVAVPFMLVAIDRLVLQRPWRAIGVGLGPWFAIAAGAAFAMTFVVQPVADPNLVTPLWKRPFVAFDAVAFYLGKLVWPVDLSVDYSRTPMLAGRSEWFWFAGVVSIGLAIASVRWKALRSPLAIFVAALLPVLGLATFEFQRISTVADRYAYLALLGPALGVASIRWSRTWTIAPVGVVLIAFGVLSARQVRVWSSDAALWDHARAVDADAIVATCNVAERLSLAGDRAGAKGLFDRAAAVDPTRGPPRLGLAKLARDEGRFDEAERWYREAMQVDPAFPAAATDLGSLLAQAGRFDEAERVLREGLRSSPDHADAWLNLGSVQRSQGRPSEALASVRRAIDLSPRHAQAHFLLAILTEDDRPARLAMRFDPADPGPVAWLARRARDGSRWDESASLAERWAALDPRDADAWNVLGQVRFRQGRVEESVTAFERAIALRPDSEALRENLRQVRASRGAD